MIGSYGPQIEPYTKVFPAEQVRIFFFSFSKINSFFGVVVVVGSLGHDDSRPLQRQEQVY